MRESDVPPPGDPENRRSRPWAILIIAAVLVFIAWFVVENREVTRPGRSGVGPGVQNAGK